MNFSSTRLFEYIPKIIVPALFATLRMLLFSMLISVIFGTIIGIIFSMQSEKAAASITRSRLLRALV